MSVGDIETSISTRRLPIGAEVQKDGSVDFRVWAPKRKKVEVIVEGAQAPIELHGEPDGYFRGRALGAGAGSLYRFRLDGNENLFPDPASRFQPQGPHGPSQVIDPAAF